MNVQLSIAIPSNPRTAALFDGRVTPDGIELIPSVVFPSELFWRQLRFADFDVSEMSFSSLMMAMAGGDERWIGLPIFTTRRFFHTGIPVHHGVAGNRHVLETAARYSFEQGLTPRLMQLEEIFAASTLDQ